MSRRRPTEASWDSDDDLLKDDLPGINAFAKAKHDGSDDELDEDALLGSDNEEIGITDENLELDEFETSQNPDSNQDFHEEQAFDEAEVSYDENFDNETYDESGAAYEHGQETYEDNEDLETSLGVEEALEIGVDEEFEEFGGDEYEISTGEGLSYSQYGGDSINTTNTEEIEHDVSDMQESDSVIQEDNDVNKDVENVQENEEEEEESESDSDDEDKKNRGRFKTERSHVVTKSSSINRTNIPDTLEITEEQQAQIDDFMDNQGRKRRNNRGGRQQGRGGNNQGRGGNYQGRGGRYPPPLMGRNPGYNNRQHQQHNQQNNQFHQQQPYQQHPPYPQQQHQQLPPPHYHQSQPNFPTPSSIPGQTYHESYPSATDQSSHVETPPEDYHLPPDHLIPPDYALSDYGAEESEPMPPDESAQEKTLTPRKIHLNPHFRPKVPPQPAVAWTEPVPLQLPSSLSQPTSIHPLPLPHPTSQAAGPYTTATPSWTPHAHTSVVPGAYPGGQPTPLAPRLHTPGPTQPYQANFAPGMQPERPPDLMSQQVFAPRSQPYHPRSLLGAGPPPLLGIREHPTPLLNSPSVRAGLNSQYSTPSRPAAPTYHQTPTHISTVRGQVPFQNQPKNWAGPPRPPAQPIRLPDQQPHFPIPTDTISPRKNFQPVGRGRGHGRGQISNRGQTTTIGRGQTVGVSQVQSGPGRGQAISSSANSSTSVSPVTTATKRLSMSEDKAVIPEKVPKCEEKEEEPIDEETRILNAKIAEQKKLREKLIRQKEMKRKLAAAQRKKELEERLAAKGLTLADIGADSTGSESDKNTNDQPNQVESKPVSNPVKSTPQQTFRPPNPMSNRPQRPQRPPNGNQNNPRLPSGRGMPNQGIRMSSPQLIQQQGQQQQQHHPRPQQQQHPQQHHPPPHQQQQQHHHRPQHQQHVRQPDFQHQPHPDQFRMQQPLMQRPFLSPPQQMGGNPRNQRMPQLVNNSGMRPPGIRSNMPGNQNRQQRPPFNINSRNPNPQSFRNPVGGPPHPHGAMRQPFRPTGQNHGQFTQNTGVRPNRHPSMNQQQQQRPQGAPPNNPQSSLINLAPNQTIRRRLPGSNVNARLGNLQHPNVQNKRMVNPKQLKQVQTGGSGENVRQTDTNVGLGKKTTPASSNRLVIQGKRTVIASSNKMDQSGAKEDKAKKVICISNLSASTTKAQLANLCKSVGAYENLQMFPTNKKAFVTFQNPEHAVIFSTKFNRYRKIKSGHILLTFRM